MHNILAAEPNNRYAAKHKQWQAAIERALERMGDPSLDPDNPIERTPRMKALDTLAEAFVKRIQDEPGMGGFKELGDRLDGKAAQAVALTGEDGGPVLFQKIERVLVRPKD